MERARRRVERHRRTCSNAVSMTQKNSHRSESWRRSRRATLYRALGAQGAWTPDRYAIKPSSAKSLGSGFASGSPHAPSRFCPSFLRSAAFLRSSLRCGAQDLAGGASLGLSLGALRCSGARAREFARVFRSVRDLDPPKTGRARSSRRGPIQDLLSPLHRVVSSDSSDSNRSAPASPDSLGGSAPSPRPSLFRS